MLLILSKVITLTLLYVNSVDTADQFLKSLKVFQMPDYSTLFLSALGDNHSNRKKGGYCKSGHRNNCSNQKAFLHFFEILIV